MTSILKETIAAIGSADKSAMAAAQKRWNSLAKPIGGLGILEKQIVQLAGVFQDPQVRLEKRELIVACADNGVVRQGVSASDASVTRIMAEAIAAGASSSSTMARRLNCSLSVIDVGMLDGPAIAGVVDSTVRAGGTEDISCGPAMSYHECVQAIELGISHMRECAEHGLSIVLLGEMGIGNTTTSCAVSSALFGWSPQELVGPGTGLSSTACAHKAEVIAQALAINSPCAYDPIDVLAKVGGLDLALLCGLCLGAARYRLPVLLDGVITLSAAACAIQLCPACRFVLLGSHCSAEPLGARLLEALELMAPVHAQMHLGEGTGALATLGLLDLALEVYHGCSSLDQLAISGYQPEREEPSCSRSL